MDSHLLLQITVLYTWTILISLTPIAAKLQGHPISRYVVEYDHSRSQSALTAFRHLVETQLKAHGIHFDDLRAYEEAPELFSGFSISIKNARSERALREASFVKVRIIAIPMFCLIFRRPKKSSYSNRFFNHPYHHHQRRLCTQFFLSRALCFCKLRGFSVRYRRTRNSTFLNLTFKSAYRVYTRQGLNVVESISLL